MTKKLPSLIFPILLILLVPLLVFWQATFGVYAMKWDIMDQFFPCRYFISECFKNGTLPFWCPYIHLGYPVYADPQAGLWYPVSFFLAATVGYNIYTIQFEFALHLAIASYGMYGLLRTLKLERDAALVGALLFPISGFFVNHASHLTWIISMSWLPWVFNYYLQGLRQIQFFRFIQSGFFLALCLTGGYVVFPVLTCYGLFLIFLTHLFHIRKNRTLVLSSLLYSIIVPLTFLLLSSGYVFSLLQSLPYLKRADGLTADIANINPFSPASFISFLFPFSTCINTQIFNTDMTMRNLYMGLPILPMLVLAVCYGSKKRNVLLLLAGIFCLLAAMGAYLPVRNWLYDSLPFMKMFRHTAIFRAFTLISFLLVAIDGLNVLYTNTLSRYKQVLAIAWLVVALSVLGLFIVAVQHENIRLYFPSFTSIESMAAFIRDGNIYRGIIVQSAFQAVILVIGLLALLFFTGRKLALAFSILWILDVAVAAQLNVAGTVVSEVSASAFHQEFEKLPSGFPNPKDTPVNHYNQYGGDILSPVVYNASILRKEPCSDGFNAFCLKDYMRFLVSEEAPVVLQQPVVFFSDRSGNALHNDSAKEALLHLQKFAPGEVEVETENAESGYVTLLQACFPGWEVMVDGHLVAPIISKQTFMTIPVSHGRHAIVYRYQPPHFYLFAGLQILSYIGFFLLAGNFYRSKPSGRS